MRIGFGPMSVLSVHLGVRPPYSRAIVLEGSLHVYLE